MQQPTGMQPKMQTVVIIGAGPAGLLLAHYLLRREQYCVKLYERRPDPRSMHTAPDRSFPISLQERGRKAIRQIPGLEAAIATEGVFCRGTIVHSAKRKARRIARKNPVLSIDRNRLVWVLLQPLLQPLLQADPDRLQLHFGYRCLAVNSTAKTVTLQSESDQAESNQAESEAITVDYDVLIGADGARSQIREVLIQQGLECQQRYVPDAYKSVSLPRCNPEIDLEADRIHTWNLDDKTRMILVPQPEDRLSGVIIFSAEQNPIETLSTPEAVLAFFQQHFPTFGQLMTFEEAKAFLNRPIARVLTVRCNRFHDGDSILLLGDSAHAVSPSIGQGCNASLEDVLILDQLLDTYADDWSKALPAFSQQRIPDAHALQELSDYSFPRNKWLVVEFFLRLTVGRLLHRWLPRLIPLFVFDLVLDTDLSYSEVLTLSQGWINKVKRSASE